MKFILSFTISLLAMLVVVPAEAQRWPTMPQGQSCFIIGSWRLVALRNTADLEVYTGTYTDKATWTLVEKSSTDGNGVLCLSSEISIPDGQQLIVTDGDWKGYMYHPLRPIIWLEDDLVATSDQYGPGDVAELGGCPSISAVPGFHAQAGSSVRMFVDCSGTARLTEQETLPLQSPPSSPPLILYPNPAGGVVRIKWPNDPRHNTSPKGLQTVIVTDIKGRELIRKSYPDGMAVLRLDIDLLPAGLYHVRLKQGSRTATGRLVVE